MTEKDFLITPVWFAILAIAAFFIRPYVTDENTRRYFMPALLVRLIAAILLGVLYQFYYGGGDTFNFHTHGSVHIHDAFMNSLVKGIKLMFASGEYIPGTYEYASQIWFYRDTSSYFVVKIAAFFDLFTFGTYSATALFFAVFSFSGSWALYQTFYSQYKNLHFYLALAILFVPSVVFWGSGLLKDTIVLGALGWSIYLFHRLFIRRTFNWAILLLILSLYLIFKIKIYVTLTLVPALLLWWLLINIKIIRSIMVRLIVGPTILILGGFLIYLLIETVAATSSKYALENLAETAQITAYDIRYGWGAREGTGSGYDLGNLDGTWQSIIELAPAAINVSLFRPYFWEVDNSLMVLAAFEALIVMVITIIVLFRSVFKIKVWINPYLIFCLLFSLIFAFAVGISTYNFGTLMRYKIPMMPLYLVALILIYHLKRDKKISVLAVTENESITV